MKYCLFIQDQHHLDTDNRVHPTDATIVGAIDGPAVSVDA
jgi:hypothetical protein